MKDIDDDDETAEFVETMMRKTMAGTETVTIREGQIWRKVDPRFERHIRVENVKSGRRGITIRAVVKSNGRWIEAPKSRASYCDPERFNGRRGGYQLL